MDKKLFGEFPSITTEQWEKVINTDLKGADYEKKLIWKTIEGFKVKPYYRKEDLENLQHQVVNPDEFPFVRGNKKSGNQWDIRQDVMVHSIAEANAQATEALAKGATTIGFITNGNVTKSDDVAGLIKGINIETTAIHFLAGKDASVIYTLLLDALKSNSSKLHGSVDFDVLGNLTISGGYYQSEEKDFQLLAETLKASATTTPSFKPLAIKGCVFQNAGATLVQEVAYSLSIANEYLATLTDKGINAETVVKSIQFNLSVGANYFLEIAKIRAFRMLWAKIAEAYNVPTESAKAYIHSVTSDWNKTLFDPYVNMLRTTTESMSAVLGGTDSLTVKPVDAVYRKTNTISERIARNTQIVLKEEAHFDKVIDPAAGSYYIENLTDSIATEAWKIFVQTEKEGGYTAALKKGTVQSNIDASATKRINDIANRRETVLGTNQYPNFNEKMLKDIQEEVYNKKRHVAATQVVKPLKLTRASIVLEELRLKTEKSGKRPKVFMLTIGSLAMRLARSQFSSNFFAVAGFEVIDNNGFKTIEDGIAAAKTAKADIIVLCSSDEEYAALAPELLAKLNKQSIMVVAGNPACIDELKAKGIENFINIKSNLLETLSGYQKMLGIN